MSIESTCKKYLEEFEKINDFHFKFGVVLLDTFMEEDNIMPDVSKAVIRVLESCNSEKEFEIANNMMDAIFGYHFVTLAEKLMIQELRIQELKQGDDKWNTEN